MASLAPNSLYHRLGTGAIDFSSDTFKVALFQSTMTGFDVDTDDLDFSDLGNESSGTGYTSGGATISVTWAVDDANNRAELTATDVTFSNATIADYQFAVIYDDTTTPKYVIRSVDYGSAKSVSGTDLTLSFPNDVFHLGSA